MSDGQDSNTIALLPDLPILSIRQPWAWLIMNAGKNIENRSWATKVRGRVLVHAAKGINRDEWYDAWDWVKHQCPAAFEKGCREIQASTIERGGIIGSVKIVDCVTSSDSPWYASGQYGFVLRDPQPLPFYPCKGKLGFFRQ